MFKRVLLISLPLFILSIFIWVGLREREKSRSSSYKDRDEYHQKREEKFNSQRENEIFAPKVDLKKRENRNMEQTKISENFKEIAEDRRLKREKFSDFQDKILEKIEEQRSKQDILQKDRLRERHIQEKDIEDRESYRLQKIQKEMFWREKMIDLEVQRRDK